MLEQLADIFRFSSIFLLVLLLLLIHKAEAKSFRKNVIQAFLFVNISFLITYWKPIHEFPIFFFFFFFFSVMFPIVFWLLSKVLFDDNFRWSKKTSLLCVLVHLTTFTLYILNGSAFNSWYEHFIFLPYLISIIFILLVIYEAMKGKDNDLIDIRLKARSIFVFLSTLLSLVSVYFFFVGHPLLLPTVFELIKNGLLTIFLILFMYHQIAFKPIFKPIPVVKPNDNTAEKLNEVLAKILHEFDHNQLYTTEGITIAMLSEKINEKEYLVRKAINGKLNYRNFNSFLNHYRITEACILLSSKAKDLTFQEVAYKLGYQSITTFNRAFKNKTGKTPSEYIIATP